MRTILHVPSTDPVIANKCDSPPRHPQDHSSALTANSKEPLVVWSPTRRWPPTRLRSTSTVLYQVRLSLVSEKVEVWNIGHLFWTSGSRLRGSVGLAS